MSPRTTIWGRAWKRTDQGRLPAGFLEVDYSIWAHLPKKARAQNLSISVPCGLWKTSEEAELNERLMSLREVIVDSRAEACLLRLPDTSSPDDRPLAALELLRHSTKAKVWLEPGPAGPPPGIPPELCVSDPLWDPGQIASPYWKIHGWHPERWVRMYAREQLAWLVNQALRLKPTHVILAHSQRGPQLRELQNFLSDNPKLKHRIDIDAF